MKENIFVALLIVGLLVIFSLISFFDQKRRLRKMKRRMLYYYGRDREIEYSDEVLSVIGAYTAAKDTMVDDITWNDLDLDSVFMKINHTWSFAGEDYLYYLLHIPAEGPVSCEEQEEMISYYQTHEKERLEMQMEFARIGKNHNYSAYAYIMESIHLSKTVPGQHYVAMLLLAAAVICIIAAPAAGIGFLVLCMGINIALYMSQRKKLEASIQALHLFLKLEKGAENIVKKKLVCSEAYQKRLEQDYKKLKKQIGNMSLIKSSNADSQSLTEIVLDYIRMISHIDCIQFYKCMKRMEKSIDVVEDLISTMGFLESLISIGSLRESLPYYCIPEFTDDPVLEILDAYHPELSEPVPNSVKAERGILLTGSNASGKSTFLKTIALNVILGQSIHTCSARQYRGAWFRVFSSMALRDNLYNGESYYIAEIRALKRIFDWDGEETVLCFVDEVLRGTNTVERIAASAQVLKKFSERGILCFAATHDIELTYLLENRYENYHFQEQVLEQEVVFDYLLYEGRSNSRNAIRLLEILGYDPDITAGAEEMVEGFLETGKWVSTAG